MPSKKGIDQLRHDEGFTPKAKHLKLQDGSMEHVKTIGYGYNLSASESPEDDLLAAGVPESEIMEVLSGHRAIDKKHAEELFQISVRRAVDDATRVIPNFSELDPKLQDVFVNMAYQLGAKGLHGFKRMRSALASEDYEGVAREIMNSKFAKKQGTNRAKRLASEVKDYAKSLPPQPKQPNAIEIFLQQIKSHQAQQVAKSISRDNTTQALAKSITTMMANEKAAKAEETK